MSKVSKDNRKSLKIGKLNYSNKNIIIGSIVFSVCIISIYYIYKYFKRVKNNNDGSSGEGYSNDNGKSQEIEVVKRPFLNLYAVMKDGSEKITNVIFITHSFTRDECETFYNEYKAKGIHFLGLSSYSEFPGPISNPHDALHDPKHKAYTYDYFNLTRGWLSVFREENNQKQK